jgi:hypothetical protein
MAFNTSTRQLLLKQNNLKNQKNSLKDTLHQAQVKNNNLLVKATDDSNTISSLKNYIYTLETKNKILENENAKLSNENRQLKLRQRNTSKLEKAVERLSKDKAKLLQLMKKSDEFNLLGHLSSNGNEITYLHSLGFFSDYDVNKIQLTNKFKLKNDQMIQDFNSNLKLKNDYGSSKKLVRFGSMKMTTGFGGIDTKNHLKSRECQNTKLFREESMWIDEGMREFTMGIRDKLNEHFSEELMEHLLFKLNSHFMKKIQVFRRSGHLFCKYCKGVPNTKKKSKKTNDGNMDFIQTLKNYGKVTYK